MAAADATAKKKTTRPPPRVKWWHALGVCASLLVASTYCYHRAALVQHDQTAEEDALQAVQLALANLFFSAAVLFSFFSSASCVSPISSPRALARGLAPPVACVTAQASALAWLTAFHVDPKLNLSAELNLVLFALSCAGTLAASALLIGTWRLCRGVGLSRRRSSGRSSCRARSPLVCVVILFAVTLVVLAAVSSAHMARERWPQGLFGRRLMSAGCDIQPRTPLIDFVPRRLLNFFVGSEDCASQGRRQFSRLERGVLTIECDPEDTPHVVLYPPLAVDANTEERNERLQYIVRTLNQTRVEYVGPMAIDAEYFVAVCGTDENFHMQLARAGARTQDGDHEMPDEDAAKAARQPYNVVVLNIDALSRNHFLRRMPDTIKWFEELHQQQPANATHQVFQFFRYHSVAFRTGPNLCPLMANKPEIVFKHCLDERAISGTNCSTLLGPDDLWWRAYERDHGHVSLWVYNMCLDFFGHYLAQDGSPTAFVDHEVVLPFCHPEYSAQRNNFYGPYSLGRRCITGKAVHDYTFDVLRQFMDVNNIYPRHRGRIAFASFMEAHEGSLAFIANVDRPLKVFLEALTREHPDTFVLLLSDHGSHMGPYFRYTAAGVLENRLPVLFLLAPQRFLRSHKDAEAHLLANEQRLFTVWDLHHTLRRLARFAGGDHDDDADEGDSKGRAQGAVEQGPGYHYYSLFETSVPADRDCPDARIPSRHCACAT